MCASAAECAVWSRDVNEIWPRDILGGNPATGYAHAVYTSDSEKKRDPVGAFLRADPYSSTRIYIVWHKGVAVAVARMPPDLSIRRRGNRSSSFSLPVVPVPRSSVLNSRPSSILLSPIRRLYDERHSRQPRTGRTMISVNIKKNKH